MNFALDYDGTYTGDPVLWLRWILDAQYNGHTVYVVTMRYPSECTAEHGFDARLAAVGIETIATSRKAKAPHCDFMGIKIHVWIDDNPKAINMDAAELWPRPAPEGRPVVPDHTKE